MQATSRGQTQKPKPAAARPSPIANKLLLRNAWMRILLSSHAEYKNFQRLEIEAFATTQVSLINLIHSQLISETYEPQPAYKVHLPKSKYANRTLTLLSTPDWLIYTAIVTLIAESAISQEKDIYNNVLFSNVPLSPKNVRPRTFFRNWQRQYGRFNKVSKKYVAEGYVFLAEVDITAFYDLIDHDLLLEFVTRYLKDVYALELLQHMLKSWSSKQGTHLFSHGIPQGPEASAFLADLFLYELDKQMLPSSPDCRYARYVDDFRIFCKTKRGANARVVYLEEEIKKLGLVPNTSKVRVFNAEKNTDWLKEESSGAQALAGGFMARRKLPKSLQKIRHLAAKQTFIDNCKSTNYSPLDTYLTRRSLPKLLPDKEVAHRIMKVYPERPDLYEPFFTYLRECKIPEVPVFCWKQLKPIPIRDWECANLILVAIHTQQSSLNKQRTSLLQRYMADISMPLSASVAAGAVFTNSSTRPTAAITTKLPREAVYLSYWLVRILRLHKPKLTMVPSERAIVRRLLASRDCRTTFVTSYLVATKFSPSVVSSLPVPQSPYSRLVLGNISQITVNPLTDEIAPLLTRVFHVNAPTGFDFRTKLGLMSPELYNRALRYLQLASWYVNTSPSYFINHIHNFNHVLLHFVLHNKNLVPRPVKWKHTFRELDPVKNPQLIASFPTLAYAFKSCSQARNTNLPNHPWNEYRSRFTKYVTYPERDRIMSQLRAAYREFIVKV